MNKNFYRYRQWFLCLLALTFVGSIQARDEGSDPKFIVEKDIRIPTRKEFTLSANIFRPLEEGRYPVIMSMGPYDKDRAAHYSGMFGNGQVWASENAAFETPEPEYWVAMGYVVITVDSPGAAKSGGDLDLFSEYEAEAFYDAIEWAGVQPWSNGKVGLNGVSYFAISQWKVARLNPPHLKAIAPEEGTIDFYRDVLNHGGIPETRFLNDWMKYRVMEAKNPGAKFVTDFVSAHQNNKLYDRFWAQYSLELKDISVPAYVVASWSDHGMHTRGTIQAFESLGSEQKWLEIHGRKKWEYYYSREHLERVRQFFDRFLKDENNGMEEVPTVRYEARAGFYDGVDMNARTWPLPNTKLEKLYLNADNILSEKRQRKATKVSYQSDGGEQVSFKYTFDKDLEVTGSMSLRLWVEIDSGDDMDLFVGLSKLDRRNKEVYFSGYNETEKGHVASGWLRASRRALDETKSLKNRPFHRHDKEQKLRPKEIVPVDIEILPSSTLFRKGESILLRIKGSELVGAGQHGREDKVNVGKHSIHMGGKYDSYIVAPIIECEDERSFF